MRPSTFGAVSPVSIGTLDMDLLRMVGEDPTDRPQAGRRALSPEQHLALDMIRAALKDANRRTSKDTTTRDDARAWLCDAAALLSARVCFESLGFDYDAVVEALRRQWSK